MCTSGAAVKKAGAHANATIVADGATLAVWSTEVEGLIEAETGMSIVANFAGYALSGAASNACSSKVAMNIIAYDTTGYSNREADTLMNMNDQTYKDSIKNIKDFSKSTLTNPN